jgi:hypothetical protein
LEVGKGIARGLQTVNCRFKKFIRKMRRCKNKGRVDGEGHYSMVMKS